MSATRTIKEKKLHMQTRLKTTIDPSYIGFRRYLQWQVQLAKKELCDHKVIEEYDGIDLDLYSEALKIIDLDAQFRKLLSEEQIEVVSYISYHTQYDKQPFNYYAKEQSAFKKWLSVFFKNTDENLCDINQIRLGKLMRKIKAFHNAKVASLARTLNVDVSTINLYVNGERLPNLNYLKKFVMSSQFKLKKVNLTIDTTFKNYVAKVGILENN